MKTTNCQENLTKLLVWKKRRGRGLSFNGITFPFGKVTILLVPSWWGIQDKHWPAGYFGSISEFALPYMCTHSFGNTPANLNPKGLFGWLICSLSTLSKSNLEWTLHWKAFVKLLGNLCFQNNSIRVLIQYLMLFCLFFTERWLPQDCQPRKFKDWSLLWKKEVWFQKEMTVYRTEL